MFNKNDPFAVTRKSIRRRITIVLIILTVVILVLAIIIVINFSSNKKSKNNETTLNVVNIEDNAPFATVEQLQVSEANISKQTKDGQPITEEMINLKIDFLKCINQQNIVCAESNYNKMSNLPILEDSSYCATLGSLAETLTDVLLAKKYYQKAYELIDSMDKETKFQHAEAMETYKLKAGM